MELPRYPRVDFGGINISAYSFCFIHYWTSHFFFENRFRFLPAVFFPIILWLIFCGIFLAVGPDAGRVHFFWVEFPFSFCFLKLRLLLFTDVVKPIFFHHELLSSGIWEWFQQTDPAQGEDLTVHGAMTFYWALQCVIFLKIYFRELCLIDVHIRSPRVIVFEQRTFPQCSTVQGSTIEIPSHRNIIMFNLATAMPKDLHKNLQIHFGSSCAVLQ